jgi:hypothetical protein
MAMGLVYSSHEEHKSQYESNNKVDVNKVLLKKQV